MGGRHGRGARAAGDAPGGGALARAAGGGGARRDVGRARGEGGSVACGGASLAPLPSAAPSHTHAPLALPHPPPTHTPLTPHQSWGPYVLTCARALRCYQPNVDYIVRGGQVREGRGLHCAGRAGGGGQERLAGRRSGRSGWEGGDGGGEHGPSHPFCPIHPPHTHTRTHAHTHAQVVIIDEATGRERDRSRWSFGLHQVCVLV